MKKNQVPRPRAAAATTQPIHTNVRPARYTVRSEGLRIPDYLAGLAELWPSDRAWHPVLVGGGDQP